MFAAHLVALISRVSRNSGLPQSISKLANITFPRSLSIACSIGDIRCVVVDDHGLRPPHILVETLKAVRIVVVVVRLLQSEWS